MIYLKTLLKVVDNSGASIAECIKVLRKRPKGFASIGDEITVVIKETKIDVKESMGSQTGNKVKRRDICRAIVVRTKAPKRREDGSVVRFDDNACVLINKTQDPLGTRISSVVGSELRKLNMNKLVTLAPKTF